MHAHGKIGSGEVIVELRAGEVALSKAHKDAVTGIVKDSEIKKVLEEAAELYEAIVAEWKRMQE
jgi:isochorismate synthase EntC